MKKTVGTVLTGLVISTLFLSACSSDTGKKANASGTSKDTITVYTAGPEGLADEINAKFEEETGIKVEMFQGTTGKILSRMEAEANNPVADVVVLASIPSMEGLKAEDKLQSYEAENGASMNEDWSDPEHYYYGYSASALGVAYNTNNVSALDADWKAFGEDEWKGRVTMPDPTSSGSAVDFLYGLTSTEKDGWDTLQSWNDNELLVAGANKESLESVITGNKDVVVSAVDYMAYKSKAKGEPIDIYYPESGTVISPRAAGILKDAKNKEGAEKFIDFLTSDEAQELVADAYLLPGNEDIPLQDRAALSEIPALPVSWDGAEEKQVDTLNTFTEMMQ
ncbi:extracellular solute-binding protein [Terribacillus sp. 179-K 1B1 HS]|uniref:ABC transporter substrate-binding protein n=1 Tax=Terribacillus sp. 179-K 1B1 HS TaxID=3142388 RepID=UPI0039A294D1